MKIRYALLLALLSANAFADTAAEIKAAVMENLKLSQVEDVEGVMATVHSQSMSYAPTKQMLHQLFPAYDLKYELVDFHYVATDGDYAYARITQSTEKVSGPAFQNNILESLQVFKKENGKWKLWAQANLTVTAK